MQSSQIAAGQFALTQQSKDAATRIKALDQDQVNYLRDRRDKINDDMVARINATEDIRLKAKLKAEMNQNHLYNRQIKLLELNNKAAKGQFKTGDKTRSLSEPITGMDNLTLTMGVRESDGQLVFSNSLPKKPLVLV